jgi:hypothetical protein
MHFFQLKRILAQTSQHHAPAARTKIRRQIGAF